MDYLKLTPLEHVPLGTGRDPRDLDKWNIGPKQRQNVSQYSNVKTKLLKRLKSEKPYGMNKRSDLPQPITFSLKYMDKAPAINDLVKSCYSFSVQTDAGNQSRIP